MVEVAEENDQITAFMEIFYLLTDEGYDFPGLISTVQLACGIEEILEHIYNKQRFTDFT